MTAADPTLGGLLGPRPAEPPLAPGDRVYVLDEGLAMLRRIMREHGHDPAPNHHGTVAELDDDEVLINFDDGGCAPYPLAEVRRLPSST